MLDGHENQNEEAIEILIIDPLNPTEREKVILQKLINDLRDKIIVEKNTLISFTFTDTTKTPSSPETINLQLTRTINYVNHETTGILSDQQPYIPNNTLMDGFIDSTTSSLHIEDNSANPFKLSTPENLLQYRKDHPPEILTIDPSKENLSPKESAILFALLEQNHDNSLLRKENSRCQYVCVEAMPDNLFDLNITRPRAYVLTKSGQLFFIDRNNNLRTEIALDNSQLQMLNEVLKFYYPTQEVFVPKTILNKIQEITGHQIPYEPDRDYEVTYINPETNKTEIVDVKLARTILQREGLSIKKNRQGEKQDKIVYEVMSPIKRGQGTYGRARSLAGQLLLNTDIQQVRFEAYGRETGQNQRLVKVVKPRKLSQSFGNSPEFYHSHAVKEGKKMLKTGYGLRAKPTIVAYNKVYTVQEEINGESLSTVLYKQSDLALGQRLMLNLSASISLKETIHDHGLIHCDISPNNILVDVANEANPTARFIDLGLSKTKNKEVETKLGTPGYIASELIYAEVCPFFIDERTDIYSLGIILVETINIYLAPRKSPFKIEKLAYLFDPYKAANIPNEIKGEYITLLNQMLSLNRMDRPINLADVIEKLGVVTEKIKSHLATLSLELQKPVYPSHSELKSQGLFSHSTGSVTEKPDSEATTIILARPGSTK